MEKRQKRIYLDLGQTFLLFSIFFYLQIKALYLILITTLETKFKNPESKMLVFIGIPGSISLAKV